MLRLPRGYKRQLLLATLVILCYYIVRFEVREANRKSTAVIRPLITVKTDTQPVTPCTSRYQGVPSLVQSTGEASQWSNLTCQNVWEDSNRTGVFDDTQRFNSKYQRTALTNKDFLQLTHDCQIFKTSRDYILTPGSPDEASFPLAFNILVHHNVQQFELLLRALYRPQNTYCVHIDAKQSQEFKDAVSSVVRCFDNVFVASKLEHIVYAGFSRLQADINCMKDQLSHSIPWHYLMNVAGEAFPLKSNAELVSILRLYNGASDVEGIYGPRVHKNRFINEWVEVENDKGEKYINQTGRRNPPPPHRIDIVRGSAYATFSRKFVHFIIHDEKARDLLEWSRTTWSPDEHYWSTLYYTYANPHLGTPQGYKGDPNLKPWLSVFVAWYSENPCQGQWVRSYCVFGVRDLPSLTRRPHLFVNKLYIDYEPLALECLYAWVRHKTECRIQMDRDYYRQLPFIIKN